MAKSKNKARERSLTVFFMFAITVVAISIVAGIHLATAATVARNETLFLRRAVREASGMSPIGDVTELVDWFERCVTAVPDADAPRFYTVEAPATAEPSSYVFPCDGTGLWGTITAMVGLSRDVDALAGVTFLKHKETPGLGARIEEEWFKAQFQGKTGPFSLTPEETPSDVPTEMDAITGATITSTAVRDMLNVLLETARDEVVAARTEG